MELLSTGRETVLVGGYGLFDVTQEIVRVKIYHTGLWQSFLYLINVKTLSNAESSGLV